MQNHDALREEVRHLARSGVYNREVLANVLVHHGSTGPARCWCGWAVLGGSLPEHIADVYEREAAARQDQLSANNAP